MVDPQSVGSQTSTTAKPGGRLRWLWETENLIVALALAVLMILPIAEVVGRKVFKAGVPGGDALQQHLVLISGLWGEAPPASAQRL